MADFEPPSFSLGLDFDLDSEPQTTLRPEPLFNQTRPSSSNPSFRSLEEDDDFEVPVIERHPQASKPSQTLKRLRRGPGSKSASAALKPELVELRRDDIEDEIEEFSSQEDRNTANEHLSTHHQSAYSSSKIPLHGHGVLSMQSASQREVKKRKLDSTTKASGSLEKSRTKLMFPKLTVSPLRRIQLLDSGSDSDCDGPSVREDASCEANKLDSSLKEKQYNSSKYPAISGQKRTKASVTASTSPTEDLWKDFGTEKGFRIPTPALDQVCEEYFRCVKDKNESSNLSRDKCTSDFEGCYKNPNVIDDDEHLCKLGEPLPPAHRYFFHNDPRIQQLVRNRFHYFFPLGAVNNRGNQYSISSVIDYRSQFSHGEGSKQQVAGKTKADTSSTGRRKNSKKLNAEEVSPGSKSWVNPKSSAGIPKDAGRRRVHAVGQSAGKWLTRPNGKKVYVTDGQELTGRNAYRHYKKATGAGFKKSKKKTAAKKKATSKKK